MLFATAKPKIWAPTGPALVDPKWQWAWAGLLLCVPIWEGAGPPRDVSPYHQELASPGSTWAWEHSEHGPILAQDGNTGVGINVSGGRSELLNLPATFNFTVEIIAKRNNSTSGRFAVCWSGQDDLLINVNDGGTGSGGVRVFWRDNGGITIDESGPDLSGLWTHTFIVTRAFNDHEAYRDGVSVATSAVGDGVVNNTDEGVQIGGSTSTSNRIDGDLALVRIYRYALPEARIAQLTRDPFGPLRMVDEAVGKVPVAPSGRIMGAIAGKGGLAGVGGLAGRGGGLAA